MASRSPDEFGAKLVGAEAPDVPSPGDKVQIIAGRYRGSMGILLAIEGIRTPSGSQVRLGLVKRPRAGATVVFSHEIRRV